MSREGGEESKSATMLFVPPPPLGIALGPRAEVIHLFEGALEEIPRRAGCRCRKSIAARPASGCSTVGTRQTIARGLGRRHHQDDSGGSRSSGDPSRRDCISGNPQVRGPDEFSAPTPTGDNFGDRVIDQAERSVPRS